MKLFCKHSNNEVISWHWTHGANSNDPAFIEVELECRDCGKHHYMYIHGRNKCNEFIDEHGEICDPNPEYWRTMEFPDLKYIKEVTPVVDKIIKELINNYNKGERHAYLNSSDMTDLMTGVRFNQAYIEALYAMVHRKLLNKGFMLVVVPDYNPLSLIPGDKIDTHQYKAVPVEPRFYRV